MDKQGMIHYLIERNLRGAILTMSTLSIESSRTSRIIGLWLLSICSMVFAMIVLGGFTRLTESGLSMTDWHPVTGWLPPLSDIAWQAKFDGYRASPEYLKINKGMSLGEFKEIFWLEYLHRLWGRIIGLAFALPFAVFVYKRWVNKALMMRLGVLFALGGLQGFIGWWMVKSGLVDHPDVSQYRLATHLLMAFLIIALGLWFALDLLTAPREDASVHVRRLSSITVVIVFITVFSGALVAGLNAGMIYNTFPLMLGEVFPSEGFQLSPWYKNFFEDIPTVQFDHRVLALTTLALVSWVWWVCRTQGRIVRTRANVLILVVFTQVILGISTLLLVVPIGLAAMHQAGAVVLLAASIWLRHSIRKD